MLRKILVCITPQSGSKRLIDKGKDLTEEFKGELNIIHVEKGYNILSTEESMILLQKLFSYASQLGGIVHGLCGEDVYEIVKKFIKKNRITDIVLGVPKETTSYSTEAFNERIKIDMPYIKLHIMENDLSTML